ncbi:phosphatidate cytidylyltransferase [Pseudoroseomonas rhizosphaerae]|uniref:Phosphatidate cytidylyltransferase n=1 Tax=Teichococcus rhizosphaerae TaxID=1335062 RepID=A0A2C7AGQ8_9PROT|nr:phosphatidate cytidylyltransferase [Pseudoroseomonas rhizosphaerae]PHK96366.1 phosphatidate cytidylyltransferase [Pseudoroseomonas rhizosphaerae]
MAGTVQPPSPAADSAKRWRDLKKRALSAAVLGPGAVLCIWLGAIPWTALMTVAIALLTWEWVRLCGLRSRAWPGIAVPAVVFVACALSVFGQAVPGLVCLLAGFLATWISAPRLRRRAAPPPPALWLAAGVLYIGLAGIALIELRHDNDAGRGNVLFLFMVVWASDIGAYLFGRLIGGPKLAPAISPGKTWSGAAGGLVSSMGVGWLAADWLAPGNPDVVKVLMVAALLGIATQLGDLLESAVKRHFKVKDSSMLIPGHGGLLDRLDGLLAAAPVAALLAFGVGYGVPLWR